MYIMSNFTASRDFGSSLRSLKLFFHFHIPHFFVSVASKLSIAVLLLIKKKKKKKKK